jgi:hypothetical protein
MPKSVPRSTKKRAKQAAQAQKQAALQISARANLQTSNPQPAEKCTSEESKEVIQAARQARGERGQASFAQRFEQQNGHPPAVVARLDMLDKDVDELDKPFVEHCSFFQSVVELGAEATVLVQLMQGPKRFLDADEVLVNPTLYQVYEALHVLCVRACLEAIGEPPQDPRQFMAIENYYVGDSFDYDVRAVFCLLAPSI